MALFEYLKRETATLLDNGPEVPLPIWNSANISGYTVMHSWSTCCKVHTLSEKYSQSLLAVPVVAEKMSYLSVAIFNTIMCHVTTYCNMIGPHRTVQRDMTCICRPFSFFVEVGLACETSVDNNRAVNNVTQTGEVNHWHSNVSYYYYHCIL